MPTRFIARLSKIDEDHLGFYVPKFVMGFYRLEEGRYKGGISPTEGDLTSCSIKLRKYKHTLRGTLPKNIGKKSDIVEVWLYRHSKTPLKKGRPNNPFGSGKEMRNGALAGVRK